MSEPKRYRKKPVVIDAMEFELGVTTKGEILAFCPVANIGVRLLPDQSVDDSADIHWFVIPTLEGDHNVSDGDYIIRGVKGEFYPCKPDIFEATYDAVEPTNPPN